MNGEPGPGRSAGVARRLAPELVTAGTERPITVDQTNMSVVVDEAVVVKWFRVPVPEPHPGVRLMTHLRAVGFTEMPPFHGAEVVDGAVTAVATGFVPGAVDGWEWYTDQFTGLVDVRRESGGGPFDDPTGGVAAVRRSAVDLGQLVARLHVALATPSTVIPTPLGTARIETEAARCARLLDEALTLTTGEPGHRLAERAERIRAALEPLRAGGSTTIQPVHGDLHVGQVLRSGTGLKIIDFDGNPLAEYETRMRRNATAVDLASLLQSIDHVGRVAINRLRDHRQLLEPLAALAIGDCLDAYRHELTTAGALASLDERLLGPLRVAQELHELIYAARHLPRWVYAPDGALCAMFP